MSNLHRIQWIDLQIRSQRYPNCTAIAREFCLSVRQASRDIEYLRYSLGAPVEFDPVKNGYYYTDQTFIIPAVLLSRDEQQALSHLARQYRSINNQMAARLAEVFERLSRHPATEGTTEAAANLQPAATVTIYPLSLRAMACLEIVKKAIASRHKLMIRYLSCGQLNSQRIIHPFLLFTRHGINYLAGYCELRQAERVFRLSRIRQVKALGQSFMIPAWFEPGQYHADCQFNFSKPYTAEIEFEQPIALPSFALQAEVLAAGKYRISFTQSTQLFSALISLGKPFTILCPHWLKQKFFTYFSEILKKNKP